MISEKIKSLIELEKAKYPVEKQQSAVIASLALIQSEQGYISQKAIQDIAKLLSMPTISVYEVASFYNMFDLKPGAKYKITMCTNLPCMLNGANEAFSYLCEKLGITDKSNGGITKDRKFSIQIGECFGACGDAPVLLVNNHQMKIKMNKAAIDELIKNISAKLD